MKKAVIVVLFLCALTLVILNEVATGGIFGEDTFITLQILLFGLGVMLIPLHILRRLAQEDKRIGAGKVSFKKLGLKVGYVLLLCGLALYMWANIRAINPGIDDLDGMLNLVGFAIFTIAVSVIILSVSMVYYSKTPEVTSKQKRIK